MSHTHGAEFRKLDLNLMKVFIALLETGSVTDAGSMLSLAQSSMSHALSRLRRALGDPLFVKSTAGMQPTPFALQLADPVRNALASIEIALFRQREFAADTSNRTFNLLLTDAGEMVFLPKLMALISRAAPNMRIAVHQRARADYREAMEAGLVDLALGQLPVSHVDFYQQKLFDQSIICVARPGHWLARNPTFEAYLEAEHLVVESPAVAEQYLAKTFGTAAARRKVKIQVRHYFCAPLILAQTDYVAMIPSSVAAEPLRTGLLEQIHCEFEIPSIPMRQFWHARTSHDPGCRWLRQSVAELFLGKAHELDQHIQPSEDEEMEDVIDSSVQAIIVA